jgi:FeS assembly protein IscX
VDDELGWHDTNEIGIQLFEKFPDRNPLDVRFTDLHRFVIELEGFRGEPSKSNEKILEAIQMAWYEEWKDANE